MDKCVYCQNHCDGSAEHVIQSALGGRVVSIRIACSRCNNAFSSATGGNIDQVLARAFEIPRNLLCVFSGRNQPPPILRNAGRLDGVPYDMLPGGVPQLRMTRKVMEADGQRHVTLIAGSIETARSQIPHLRRQYGSALEFQAARIGGTWAKEPAEFTITLGDPGECRGVAKIGMNLLARFRNVDVHDSAFDAARVFVTEGKAAGEVGCHVDFVNEFPLPQREDDTAHLVAAVADPDTGLVVAYIRLFGGVQYSAILCQSYRGPAARIALRHGAEDRRKEVVRDFAAPSRYDRSVIHRYQELAPQHWPGVEAAFSKVCRRYYDVARVKVVGEIVDKAMAEAQLEGEIIEGRQIEAFEAAFGKGVERYLLREDHSQEVALEDLFGDAGVPSVG